MPRNTFDTYWMINNGDRILTNDSASVGWCQNVWPIFASLDRMENRAKRKQKLEVTKIKKKTKTATTNLLNMSWKTSLGIPPCGCGCLFTLEPIQYNHFHQRLSFSIYIRWRNKNLCPFPRHSILVAHSHKTSTSIFRAKMHVLKKSKRNGRLTNQKEKKITLQMCNM